MQKIIFQCETITPMFLAGADGKTPELRPPSIKAAMRFWWRAINGHLQLPDLKEKEALIFGGSGKNEERSKFSIRVKNIQGTPTNKKFPSRNVNTKVKGKDIQINVLEYLAYGTLEYKKGFGQVFIRDYYPAGTTFNIEIDFHNTIDKLFNIKEIIGLISQVGGLGSRARNGFGRFSVKGLDFDLLSFLKKHNNFEKNNFLIFNKAIKLYSLKSKYNTWDECLAELGKIYKTSREKLEPRHVFEKRQFIASPILENKKQQSLLGRHTKPYFFVIKKSSENFYEGSFLFIPYNYLQDYDNPPKDQTVLNNNFEKYTSEFNSKLKDKDNMRVLL
jgi:CRISPR-associated protein Cmr1